MPKSTFHSVPEVRYGVAETVIPSVRRVVAHNPSAFTARGTATFVLGKGNVAVIDPGPALDEHVEALLHGLRNETVTHILVTHTHRDHSPAWEALQKATGAKTYGYGPHAAGKGNCPGGDYSFIPDVELRDGDVVEGDGWTVGAVHTPGHTSNHLCFAWQEEDVLFSGDHVMGWSTTVVAPPDGDMGAYMRSLRKLLSRRDRLYVPTHGAPIEQPQDHVRFLLEHRERRARSILDRLKAGDRSIPDIVTSLYGDRMPELQRAAARTVLAHLIDLTEAGVVRCDGQPPSESAYTLCSLPG